MASYTVVEASGDILADLVESNVDILIANEDEAAVFTGYSDESKALSALSAKTNIAVLNVGARGSYISQAGDIVAVKAMGKGDVHDTTGAGDLWAAGFLFGLVSGFPIEMCGRLGAACGYEVCRVIGAKIPEDGWKRVRKLLF